MKDSNFTLLNFGPQHPAAHGVLRLLVSLNGEIVRSVDPNIGFLHRGTQKLIEYKTYTQALPYFDRLDYVSVANAEHAYSLAVERISREEAPSRAQLIRVLLDEMTRILNHLLAITAHAMDVGALTPFLWGFEEREEIMFFMESLSGARMHLNLVRPGGIAIDLPSGFCDKAYGFFSNFEIRLNEIDELLSLNRIWLSRCLNVGLFSAENSSKLSYSGPFARASGLLYDVRKNFPYSKYTELDFLSFFGNGGDCYARYLLRLQEMRESTLIILRVLPLIQDGPFKERKLTQVFKPAISESMEAMIQHFKFFAFGYVVNGDIYTSVEAPKGEFGVFFQSLSSKPSICKIRAPGFFHLQGMNSIVKGGTLSDLVAVIGSLDIVFGEIDR